MNSVLLGRQGDLFLLGSKRYSVAEVTKTLENVPAVHPISWRDWLLAGETYTSAVTSQSLVTAYLLLAELFVAPKATGAAKLSTCRLITGVDKWEMTIFISAS